MTLVTLAMANLKARPGRTLATLASVALAIASFIALIGIARGVERSLLDALDVRQTDVIVTERGAVDLISSIVRADLADRLAAVPEVAAAAAELTRVTSLESGGSAAVVAWAPGAYPWQALTLVEGRLPSANDARVAVVGASFADRQGLRVGDTLSLFQAEFTVIGIAGSDSLLARNLVMVPLAVAQALTFRAGQATAINVRLSPVARLEARDALLARLRTAFPDHAVEATETLAGGHTFARIADVLSRAISLVALAGAVFAIFNTMSMAVRERRGELAIMAAVGWPRGRIVRLILLEAVVLSGLGGVLGCAAGVLVAEAVARGIALAGLIEPAIGMPLLLQGVAISLLIGLGGAFAPAWRTASLSPASVLRGK